MAQTFPITAGASPLPASMNGYDTGALVLAVGGTVLCADTGSGQVDPVPVQPGDSLNWPAGRPLWVSATTAGVSAIVEPSGAQLFSASGVASQILSQGLAQQIAQQVNLQGVPPVDQPALLYTKTGTVAANASWNLGLDTSNWIDISKYNSLFVHVVANAQTAPNVADSYVCSAWTTSNLTAPITGATLLTLESVECPLTQETPDSNGSWCQMILPAYGKGLWVSFEPVSSGSYAINYTITVTGSYKSVSVSKTYAQNQHFLNPGNMPQLDDPTIPGMDNLMYGFSYTIPASSGQYVGVMSHINTPYDVTFVPETGTTPVGGTDIYISTGEPNRQIIGVYGDKTTIGTITRWEKILNGGRAPHLYVNNHDTFSKNYNFVFSFCR